MNLVYIRVLEMWELPVERFGSIPGGVYISALSLTSLLPNPPPPSSYPTGTSLITSLSVAGEIRNDRRYLIFVSPVVGL